MFGFHIRTRSADSTNSQSSPRPVETPRSGGGGSPRIDVGEIDTSAPFQSVKAAVSLFGEAGSSPRTSKPLLIKKPKNVDERVLEKETQLHLALKELDDCRGRLKSTETTKAQAFRELEKANRTLQELTSKLEIISESKQTAIEATEAAKQRAQDLEERKTNILVGGDAWKQDVDNEREQYKASATELISAKQELTTLRQDFDVVLEAKLAAFQEAADAQHITLVNQDRVTQISKEITTLRETLGQVRLATLQAQEERNKHNEETQAHFQSHKLAKEQVEAKIKSLKEESDPEPSRNLEEKLEETMEAIKLLREQLNSVRDSDMSSLKIATAELDDARKELQEIVEEENSQRSSVDPLKMDLDNVKSEHSQLKNKAFQAESTAESLQVELEGYKTQLEGKLDPQEVCDDILLKLQQLVSEAENARQEEEEIKKNIAVLKQEAETACTAAKEAEERLNIALNEVEEAKAAERQAGDMIHNSSKTDAAHDSSSNSNSKIKLSLEDFESLSKKADESRADADLKVATVMAQIETINSSENEKLEKLEASMKEKEAIEAAIEEALKQAEMAEAAKQVVEGELMKWRQKEQDIVEVSSNF